jgi:hypothetical protein
MVTVSCGDSACEAFALRSSDSESTRSSASATADPSFPPCPESICDCAGGRSSYDSDKCCLKRVQAQSSEIRGRHRTFLAGQEQGCGTSVRQQSHTCKFWSADLCASEQLPCPRRISAFTGMVAPAFDRNCSSRCMCKLLNLCHWGHSSRLWSLTRIRLSRAEPLLRPDWPA